MNLKHLKMYMLAGRVRFTAISKAAGHKITYIIYKCPKHKPTVSVPPWFVSFINSEGKRVFLGNIFKPNGKYKHSQKSKMWHRSETVSGFIWIWKGLLLNKNEYLADHLEIEHNNKCGRCKRTLTSEDSISKGLGPVCENKLKKEKLNEIS